MVVLSDEEAREILTSIGSVVKASEESKKYGKSSSLYLIVGNRTICSTQNGSYVGLLYLLESLLWQEIAKLEHERG